MNSAYEFGKLAEKIISEEYIKKGYTVIERRWRAGKSEVDLIVQKENTIVVVEVKARSGRDEDAFEAVSRDKRKRMVKIADSYIRGLKGIHEYRFDIATLTGDPNDYRIEIYEDAFLPTDLI